MPEFTIGVLAKNAGVPTSTVRYYERRGILQPKARTECSYRLYGPDELERLRFIKMAQSLGFTLDDAVVLLKLRDNLPAPREQVNALIKSRLAQVDRQLDHLKEVKCLMETALEGQCPADCTCSNCSCSKCDLLVEFQELVLPGSVKCA